MRSILQWIREATAPRRVIYKTEMMLAFGQSTSPLNLHDESRGEFETILDDNSKLGWEFVYMDKDMRGYYFLFKKYTK